MGVDMTDIVRRHKRRAAGGNSTNPYIKLLTKLYKYLAVRTKSKFNKLVYQRMLKSRTNRAPVSLSRMCTVLRRKTCWMDLSKQKAPIVVVCADVLDDIRSVKIPAVRVCAMRFSRSARERITGAGGECLTFDQLALQAPTGKNTLLMRGRRAGAEKYKHFGAPGTSGSHAKPYVSSRGKEVARGRRGSRAYKKAAFKHRQFA